jgi:hypothetical protein
MTASNTISRTRPAWPADWRLYFARGPGQRSYRPLSTAEIEVLKRNRNRAESWKQVRVSDGFRPEAVCDCSFRGRVLIGSLREGFLEQEALRLPVGLELSSFSDCELGDNVAIVRAGILDGVIVGDGALLFDIGEICATREAPEEPEALWLEVGNENGGRRLRAAGGLLPADACLWTRFRDDRLLQERLEQIGARESAREAAAACLVGDEAVITHCRLIRDARVMSHCTIRGANELRALLVQSNSREPSFIGSGVELINGIVGFGNSIENGVKALDFQTGRNVRLQNGARVLQTYLGANSTIACCEILSNLILPFHEQHHNNSFLIASTLLGQTNMGAGATIGSNHNSRAADGEIVAGRGFWPGLCVSLKHNSRFASFTLLATGLYAWEMDIPLPFSLVSLETDGSGVRIMPGYWFRHNMYALERNARKFTKRDRRQVKAQHIEFDYLAPDTAGEMLAALGLLEEALARRRGGSGEEDPPVNLEGIAARRRARILKPLAGCRLYRSMLVHYGARELLKALERKGREVWAGDVSAYVRGLCENPPRIWHNLGGQLMPAETLEAIMAGVRSGALAGYDDLHAAYDRAWREYPEQKTRHALFCLCRAGGFSPRDLTEDRIAAILEESAATAERVFEAALSSRRKDYENPFRAVTYRNSEEMRIVLGDLENNAFLEELRLETKNYRERIRRLVRIIKQRKET